jgi:hypothetical protein
MRGLIWKPYNPGLDRSNHMAIRVLAEGWRNQYDRMLRSRAKLDEKYISSLAYDDDFYHATQDIWHLKDWLANDDTVDPTLRSTLVREAEGNTAIGRVADLANCTKHLVLTKRIREGAGLAGANLTLNMQEGRVERDFVVTLADGSAHSGLSLVDDAVNAWTGLLRTHGLLS